MKKFLLAGSLSLILTMSGGSAMALMMTGGGDMGADIFGEKEYVCDLNPVTTNAWKNSLEFKSEELTGAEGGNNHFLFQNLLTNGREIQAGADLCGLGCGEEYKRDRDHFGKGEGSGGGKGGAASAPVPDPASIILFGAGLIGVAGSGAHRNRKK